MEEREIYLDGKMVLESEARISIFQTSEQIVRFSLHF